MNLKRVLVCATLVSVVAAAAGLPKFKLGPVDLLADASLGQSIGASITFKPVADRVYRMDWKFSEQTSPFAANNLFQVQLYSSCVAGFVANKTGFGYSAMTAFVEDDFFFKTKYTTYLVLLNEGELPESHTSGHGTGWGGAVPRDGGIGFTLCPKIVKPELLWFKTGG